MTLAKLISVWLNMDIILVMTVKDGVSLNFFLGKRAGEMTFWASLQV